MGRKKESLSFFFGERKKLQNGSKREKKKKKGRLLSKLSMCFCMYLYVCKSLLCSFFVFFFSSWLLQLTPGTKKEKQKKRQKERSKRSSEIDDRNTSILPINSCIVHPPISGCTYGPVVLSASHTVRKEGKKKRESS